MSYIIIIGSSRICVGESIQLDMVLPRKTALAKMVILEIGVLINVSVPFVSLPCARRVGTLTFMSTTSEPCHIISESWGA